MNLFGKVKYILKSRDLNGKNSIHYKNDEKSSFLIAFINWVLRIYLANPKRKVTQPDMSCIVQILTLL